MNVIENPNRASDSDLLAKYRASRSPQPLEELLRRYYGFVVAVCRRELGDADLARDAAQEVVLEFVKRADRLEARPSLASWLFRVAQTRSRDLRRSEARRKRPAMRTPNEPSDVHVEVHAAIQTLPEDERAMLLARYIGGYSFEELGEHASITPDAARMRVQRTLERLRERLASAALLAGLDETLTNEEAVPLPLISINSRPAMATRLLPVTAALVGSFATLSLIGKPFASPAAPADPTPVLGSYSSQGPVDLAKLEPFYAEVETSSGLKSRYWRTEEGIRAIERFGQKETHVKVSDKEALTMVVLPEPPGPIEGRIIRGGPSRRVMETDAWEVMLLQLPVLIYATPMLSPWPLEEALKGKSGSEVQLKHPDGKRNYRVWLDAGHGNMPSKCEYVCRISRETEFRYDIQVKEWQRAGGHWFPKKVERRSFFNGKSSESLTFTIRGIKLGKEVPASPTMPKPTRNAIVLDEARRVWYRVDENWKRITQEVPTQDGNVRG